MGLSRFLGKHLLHCEGIYKGGDGDGPAVVLEGTKPTLIGGATIEGDATATGMTVNTLAFKGSAALTNIWGIVASLDLGAIGPTGSTNAVLAANTAMSGAAVGDFMMTAPVSSCNTFLMFAATCISANNVQIRAAYLGSGGLDPGVITLKVYCIK